MTSFGDPRREDGWRPGGAQAARVELLRQRKVHMFQRANELWTLASVCQGFGGWVGSELAQQVNDAIWEACNADSAWREALLEEST
jgi:hypothetical protein